MTGVWDTASGDLVRKVSLAKPGFVLMSVRIRDHLKGKQGEKGK